MKFLQIIEKFEKQLVNEMDDPPPNMAPPPDGPSSPPAPEPEHPGVDEPAGIATMGTLLKKALTLKLSDEDRYKVSQLPNIDEQNASEIINQLITIMKTYSVDTDINTAQ
jgi:hypothetical protein